MSESEIQKDIIDYLKIRQIKAWRTNAGKARNNIRLAPRFTSDIIGYLPNGLFLGIEVKKMGENPTDGQRKWLDDALSCGCAVCVARSVEDVEKFLEKVL